MSDIMRMGAMIFFVLGLAAAAPLPAAVAGSSSQIQFASYCAKALAAYGKCPQKVCRTECPDNAPTCAKPACVPLACDQIKGKDCPKEYCATLTDCSGEKVCADKTPGGPPKCGGLAYAGQDVPCCPGLVRRCGVEFYDGTCDMQGRNSVYSLPICIPCGDGICGQFENRCNCPEDCQPQTPSPKRLRQIFMDRWKADQSKKKP